MVLVRRFGLGVPKLLEVVLKLRKLLLRLSDLPP